MEKIDNLLKKLDSVKDSLEHVELLLKISKLYRNSDNLKAIEYADKSKLLSIKTNNKLGEAKSLRFISLAKFSMGKSEEVLKLIDEYLDIYKQIGNIRGICWSLFSIGNCNFRLGDYEKAIDKFYEVLKILKNENYEDIRINVIHSLALLYDRLKNYDKAILLLLELKEIYEKTKENNNLFAILNNLGNIYTAQKKYSEAKVHYMRAKEIVLSMGKENFIIGISVNLASLEMCENNYENALNTLLSCQSQLSGANLDLCLEGEIFNLITECHLELKNFSKAYEFMKKSMTIARRSKDNNLIITNLKTLEKISVLKNDYKKAYKTIKELSILKDKKFQNKNVKSLKIIELDLELEKEKHHSKHLEIQGNYLKALNDFSKIFSKGKFEKKLEKIVKTLGKVTRTNRTYFFKNHKDTNGKLLFSKITEYVSIGISPEIINPLLQNVQYEKSLPSWYKTLKVGQIILGNITDFPKIEKEHLETHGIKSILILPIIVDNEFWGVMGFDNCEAERKWEKFELEYLKSYVEKIVNRIKIQNHIEILKNENKKFKMTQDSIKSFIYVSNIDTYEIQFLNKTGRKIFGNKIGEKCYSVFQGLTKPCDFCSNHLLIDNNGKSKAPHIWKFKSTINNEWYQYNYQAIKWSDGKLVRFVIATNINETENYKHNI